MVFVELRAHPKLMLEVQTIKGSVLREAVRAKEREIWWGLVRKKYKNVNRSHRRFEINLLQGRFKRKNIMPKPSSAMEVFKHLEKSNCRECGEKTCLAFAASVYQSRKQINMCSRLDADIISRFSDMGNSTETIGEMGDQLIEDLKRTLRNTDLAVAAQRCGGVFDGSKLTLKILGKKFCVDSVGDISSDIHVNPWILTPFLDYVVGGRGKDPVGNWISFRELNIGKEFSYAFFQKRCEQVMKNIADQYMDWFDDLVHLFGGQRVAEQFESDVSVVIYPLPKVPIMICYWGVEDGMESTLNLLFDK